MDWIDEIENLPDVTFTCPRCGKQGTSNVWGWPKDWCLVAGGPMCIEHLFEAPSRDVTDDMID